MLLEAGELHPKLGNPTTWTVRDVRASVMSRVLWLDNKTMQYEEFVLNKDGMVATRNNRAATRVRTARHIHFCRATKTVLVLR